MYKKVFKIVGVIIVIVAILFAVIMAISSYWATPVDKVQNTGAETIEIKLGHEITNDFGDIDQQDGNFVQSYRLINSSNVPMQINGAKTSCACTKVKIKEKSFGMHSFDTPTLSLNPGESEIIEVIFDPALHGPFGKGSIKRTITLSSPGGQETGIHFYAVVK